MSISRKSFFGPEWQFATRHRDAKARARANRTLLVNLAKENPATVLHYVGRLSAIETDPEVFDLAQDLARIARGRTKQG